MIRAYKTIRWKEMTITLSERCVENLALIRKSTSFIGSDEGLVEMLLSDVLRAKVNYERGKELTNGE